MHRGNAPAVMASGIRPPEYRDGLWFVEIVHERVDIDGKTRDAVVGSYVLTTRGLRRSVWTAMRALRHPAATVASLMLYH